MNTKPDYNYFAPQLTSNTPIYGFGGYHAAVWPILPGSDEEHEWCLVGYPSENGSGSYIAPLNELAVSAFSDEKEQYGAWLFIKELVSYDMQYRTPGEDVAAYPAEGFPINNEAFEQIAAEASAHEGEPNYGTASGIETDAGNITAAEVEACKELINSKYMNDDSSRDLYINKEINGDDVRQIVNALDDINWNNSRPHLIISDTTKGYGISYMENVAKWHHGVPNEEQYEVALSEIDKRIHQLYNEGEKE